MGNTSNTCNGGTAASVFYKSFVVSGDGRLNDYNPFRTGGQSNNAAPKEEITAQRPGHVSICLSMTGGRVLIQRLGGFFQNRGLNPQSVPITFRDGMQSLSIVHHHTLSGPGSGEPR